MAVTRKYNLTVREKTYVLTLAKLFLAGSCTRYTLLPASLTENAGFVLVNRALRRGDIRIGQYREKYGNRYRDQKYLALTEKGLAYLRSQSALSWLSHIPADLGYVIPFPNTNPDTIALVSRSGNALLMALEAGASLTDFVFTGEYGGILCQPQARTGGAEASQEEDFDPYEEYGGGEVWDEVAVIEEEGAGNLDETGEPKLPPKDSGGSQGRRGTYLSEIRKATYLDALAGNLDFGAMPPCQTGTPPVYYFPRAEVKLALAQAGPVGDIAYTKMTGILCHPERSIILYHAKHDGFGWLNVMERRDVHSACRFSSYCSPYKNITVETARAAILIYGSKNFGDILRNKWRKRSAGTELGKIYKAVNLIPLGANGAHLLRDILAGNLDATVDRVARETYHATPNTGPMKRSFPYLINGTNVFVGADMDYKRISLTMRALDRQEKQTGTRPTFVVLCYRWQMAHYNNLWPGVPFYPLDP